MSAEVPDVTVWVGSGKVERESTLHAHAVRLLHYSRRAVDFRKVVLALQARPH